MEIERMSLGDMDNNCYILYSKGCNEAVLIDAPCNSTAILQRLSALGLKPMAVLLTHAHFDHIGAVAQLQKEGATIYVHALEAEKLSNNKKSYAIFASRNNLPQKVTADVILQGGESLHLAGLEIQVIHTPGHSAGSVCYLSENNLFSGDTLFYGTYGRTDFYDGDFMEIEESIRGKLFALADDVRVYPGHGQESTIAFERTNNDILFD